MNIKSLSQSRKRRFAAGVACTLLLLIFIYWRHSLHFPTTDDAYVQANVVNIAPEVNGKVVAVFVSNNQFVRAGTPLIQIDTQSYEAAVSQATAQLQLAKQQVDTDKDAVRVAESLVSQREAEYQNSQKNFERTMSLVKQGTGSRAEGDNAKAQFLVAEATLRSAKVQLQQASDKLGLEIGNNNAQIRSAQAMLDQALLNLKHTRVVAPSDGIVTNFTVRTGAVVTTGQPLFQFIENSKWWVNANYKETQLMRIHPGQHARITIDSYPGKIFQGIVQSISSGSGEAFSLLPPENATGNWVKVTQRVPVRVEIINTDPAHPLRVGLSSTVTIDTRH